MNDLVRLRGRHRGGETVEAVNVAVDMFRARASLRQNALLRIAKFGCIRLDERAAFVESDAAAVGIGGFDERAGGRGLIFGGGRGRELDDVDSALA